MARISGSFLQLKKGRIVVVSLMLGLMGVAFLVLGPLFFFLNHTREKGGETGPMPKPVAHLSPEDVERRNEELLSARAEAVLNRFSENGRQYSRKVGALDPSNAHSIVWERVCTAQACILAMLEQEETPVGLELQVSSMEHGLAALDAFVASGQSERKKKVSGRAAPVTAAVGAAK